MEEQIEEIKNALRDVVQQLVQRGQPLTPDLKALLVEVMEHAASRIQQLRQQEQQEPVEGLAPTAQAEPPLDQSMPSSNIHSFGYDDKTGRLLVKFQGDYPQENGPIYGYRGIPKQIFDLFQKGAVPARTNGKNKWGKWFKGKVPSLGASLYTLIKGGGYPYERLG